MLASVVPETGIGIYAELALEHHFRGPLRLLASSGADTLFVCMEDLERDSPKHAATVQKVRDHLLGPTPTDAAPLALPSTGIKYTGPHATAAQVSSPERTRLLDALDEIDRTHLNGALRRALRLSSPWSIYIGPSWGVWRGSFWCIFPRKSSPWWPSEPAWADQGLHRQPIQLKIVKN